MESYHAICEIECPQTFAVSAASLSKFRRIIPQILCAFSLWGEAQHNWGHYRLDLKYTFVTLAIWILDVFEWLLVFCGCRCQGMYYTVISVFAAYKSSTRTPSHWRTYCMKGLTLTRCVKPPGGLSCLSSPFKKPKNFLSSNNFPSGGTSRLSGTWLGPKIAKKNKG